MFRLIGSLLVAVAVIGGGASCNASPSGFPEVDADFVSPAADTVQTVTLEVAANENDRRKGLMFRNSMPERRGMLFLFPQEQINSFWMKNTVISLDMIFIDKDWKVVGVLHSVPPQNDRSRKVDKPSQYVIELGAGVAKKFKIEEGSKVVVKGTLPSVS